MPTGGSHVVVLGRDDTEPSELGGKGSALARLFDRGSPVPPTAVVGTTVYRRLLQDPELAGFLSELSKAEQPPDPGMVDEAFLRVPLGDEDADRIIAAARQLGPEVAVRSSAGSEDLGDQSFAGQYRSFLDVRTEPEPLLRAVRLVWASLWHPAPWSYRRAWAIADDDAEMAVVLMAMVPAVRAGVVFTVDPGGEADRLRVEVVDGLAESLVSGQRTPSVWLLPTDGSPLPDGAPEELTEVRRLALALEAAERRPLDIEWAWDGTTTWIVQSRPVTVQAASGDGFDTPIDDHELTTAGIEEMLPGVLPPLRWEVNAFLVEEALRGTLQEMRAMNAHELVQYRFLRRVRGRAALDLDLLKLAAAELPGGSAGEIERQYFGEEAAAIPPTTTVDRLRSLRHQLRTAATRRRALTDAGIVGAAVEAVVRAPAALDELDDAALLAYRLRLLDLAVRAMTAELAVAAAAGAAYGRLEQVLTANLDAGRASSWAQTLTRGAGVHRPLHAGASRSVFAGPTWTEEHTEPPTAAPVDGDPTRFRDALRGLAAELRANPGWQRRRILTGQVIDIRMHLLRRLVADAVFDLGVRERTKAAVLALGGEVRRVHLELGHRLTARGALPEATDIELLRTREIVDALHLPRVAPALLGRRRRFLDRWQDDEPLPERFVGNPAPKQAEVPIGDRLEGRAASPGRATSSATVVHHPNDPFPDGDVLVATATDAGWSPLFLRASAIVVERGGPLSHAAIVARELGVPAVLDVHGATLRLDGQLVTVDGDAGVVVIHPETIS